MRSQVLERQFILRLQDAGREDRIKTSYEKSVRTIISFSLPDDKVHFQDVDSIGVPDIGDGEYPDKPDEQDIGFLLLSEKSKPPETLSPKTAHMDPCHDDGSCKHHRRCLWHTG